MSPGWGRLARIRRRFVAFHEAEFEKMCWTLLTQVFEDTRPWLGRVRCVILNQSIVESRMRGTQIWAVLSGVNSSPLVKYSNAILILKCVFLI